jgi:RNA polymerase sigma-70 factor (ECF subfamily)
MGISEKTVEKQIAKGARLIADYFHGGAVAPHRRTAQLQDAEQEN